MGKAAVFWATIVLAAPTGALAQQPATAQPNSCQRFMPGAPAHGPDRELLYLRAACVAARAGVASPADGRLNQEELMSILMLMSLQQTSAPHAS